MNTRRVVLQRATVASLLMAVGMLPILALAQGDVYNTAAFEAQSLDDLVRALGASAPIESNEVALQAPDIAENGAVVPVGVSTALPGVKRLLLLIEKNPNILAAMFDISDAVVPAVSTRVKMGQSSNVFAVAMMDDGRVLYAHKDVKVTLGGCGD
ncbi:MAG: thiosulfate oxidation carrier protein SoxY [Burkholderiaceae bacterium]|nr:thiosulfate oxidation carrier protein SoxY [Burkholderiaceae bacterium]